MHTPLLKGTLVVIGALFVSSIGLNAADSLRGIDRSLLGLTLRSEAVCPVGMVEVHYGHTHLCADAYENSPSAGCPHAQTHSVRASRENIATPGCTAVSAAGRAPWTTVTLSQAQTLCARVDKRVPRSDEWYALALGTRTDECVVDAHTGPHETGTHGCVSSSGAHDAVGNVWEWVSETVVRGVHAGRTLPREGHVTSVDKNGIAITTSTTSDPRYHDDYFWGDPTRISGMIRGGFYGSGADAGLYAVNASVPPDSARPGVGFRCVRDV